MKLYREVLHASWLTLCPASEASPETHRIYEAIQVLWCFGALC